MDVIMKGIRIILTAVLTVIFVNSALAANFFNVQSSGLNLIVNTQVPTHPSPYLSAGIKILNPNFYSLSPPTNCLFNFATGYCSFPVGNSQPAVISLVGNPGLVTVSLCLRADPFSLATPISCQNYTVGVGGIPTPPPPPIPVLEFFAYVVNESSGEVSKCNFASNGTLINCSSTLTGLNAPFDIALNQSNTLAYVSTQINTILKCGLVNGDLVNCSPTGNGFATPQGIAINPAGNFAYIANSANATISKCPIINGDLVGCTPTGSGLGGPQAITINPAGTFAYITNLLTFEIVKCTIAGNGDLTPCAQTGPVLIIPEFVGFNKTGNTAYVTSNVGVFACQVNNLGNLINCVPTGGFGLTLTTGIALNATGNLVYISIPNANTVSTCTIDPNNLLINCTNSANVFQLPAGIALIGGS
jgi:hypothetical protein